MKRWILVRVRADLNQVRRPLGRGYIGHSPVWIDTREGPDFYAKQVRKGLLELLDEADENPRLAKTAPVAEPAAEADKEEAPPKKKAKDSDKPE